MFSQFVYRFSYLTASTTQTTNLILYPNFDGETEPLLWNTFPFLQPDTIAAVAMPPHGGPISPSSRSESGQDYHTATVVVGLIGLSFIFFAPVLWILWKMRTEKAESGSKLHSAPRPSP